MNLYDFKKSIYSALVFFGMLLVLSVAYAAYQTINSSEYASGQPLTQSLFGKVVSNLADLNTRVTTIETSAKTAEAWSVKNTGNVGQVATWTAIPGLSSTFTLSRPAIVHLMAWGVQRYVAGDYCQVSYRYVIDGVPRGDATWGQHIQMSNNTIVHMGWDMVEAENLAAGSHTIRVDAKNDGTANWCYICSEISGALMPYDSCTMNISAFYQ